MSSIVSFPFAHTYSIVARDPVTGQMGVAVQSHWFAVGSVVTWGEAGVGVVATQAMAEVGYGPKGLARMRAGEPAPQALAALLAADDQREVRQVAMMDAAGGQDVHTGSRCISAAGHIAGAGFSVQANMMANDTVWPAMAKAFTQAAGDLAERLLAALEAAQQAGGDIRGQQSAALLVVAGKKAAQPWEGALVNLRVDDHQQPLVELQRLVRLQRAYNLMNAGDAYLALDQVAQALVAYRQAAAIAPEIDELPFWHAVTLAEMGRVEEALPILQQVYAANPDWRILLQRLPAAGLLKDDPQLLARLVQAV